MSTVHSLDAPAAAAPSLIRPRTGHATQHAEQTTPQRATRTNTGAATGRPMSSTPAKNRHRAEVTRATYSPPSHELVGNSSLLDNSVSTVQSSDPRDDERKVGPRPLSMEDLERRPGSPDVVIVPGSDHEGRATMPTGQGRATMSTASRLAPLGGTQPDPPRNTLFEAPRPAQPQQLMSLDDAWKNTQDDEVEKQRKEQERRRQEEEDRAYEEEQRRRDEERRKKQEEAWEKEQELLRQMEQGESGGKAAEAAKSEDKVEDKPSDDKESIDPTMLKYMEMVQQQKQHEKEIVKKAVDVWNKNKPERTPSQSEDLSMGLDKSEADVSDGDFW